MWIIFSPTHTTWVEYTQFLVSFLQVLYPKVFLNPTITRLLHYLEFFHLDWVTCVKTHSIQFVITTLIMNQSIVLPFIENTLTSTWKILAPQFQINLINLTHVILSDNTSCYINNTIFIFNAIIHHVPFTGLVDMFSVKETSHLIIIRIQAMIEV